jgi:hypothetical protein
VALVATQEGTNRLLTWLLQLATPVIPTLHLLGQPYQPLHTSMLSNFAANEVAHGIGYAPVALSPPKAGWTLSGLTDGAEADYLTVSWTFTAAATVYGYYVSDDTFSVSLWGELLAQSYPYGSGGGVFALKIPLQLTSQPFPS